MSGHSGHSGHSGSQSAGVGGAGGGDFVPVLPDRVDLPFVTETVDNPDPSGSIHISDGLRDIKEFPARRWSADWHAWYALSEYVQTDWRLIAVDAWKDPRGKDSTTNISEIDVLVAAARDERADALGEIVAQHDGFASYFFALLSVDPALYPATNLLINISTIVGTFTALYFKNGTSSYKPRPRPSQVCPALLPPVPIPGHPSYPSGRATGAHLIEGVLNEVFSVSQDDNLKTLMANDLAALSSRIARNREIAGLHYPSDSQAGKKLASDIHALLRDSGLCPLYNNAIADARKEWGLQSQ